MGHLTAIFPRPRPLVLGGRTFLVGELRLCDLADLQAAADAAWPDPLGDLRDRLPGMDEVDRNAALRAAYDAAEAGPPAWSGPTTDAELVEFVRVALAVHDPGFTAEDAAGVVAEMTALEYGDLFRACRGVTPLDEIEAWLGVDHSRGGSSIPWAQAICEVLEAYPGLSLADVEGMTVSQVRALRSGGRPEVRGISVKPGMDLKAMLRASRAKFRKPDEKGAG